MLKKNPTEGTQEVAADTATYTQRHRVLWKSPCQSQDSHLQKADKDGRRQSWAAVHLILHLTDHAEHGEEKE